MAATRARRHARLRRRGPRRPPTSRRLPAAVSRSSPLPWARRTPRAQLAVGRALRRLAARAAAGHRPPALLVRGRARRAALPHGVPLVYTPHGYAFGRSGDRRAAARRGSRRRAADRPPLRTSAPCRRPRRRWRASGSRAPRVSVVRNGIPELDGAGRLRRAERDGRLLSRCGRSPPGAGRRGERAHPLAALDDARVRWIGGGRRRRRAAARRRDPASRAGCRGRRARRLGEATVSCTSPPGTARRSPLLEAFARDVVVVASDIPANREVLGPHQVCADEAAAVALVALDPRRPRAARRLLAASARARAALGAGRMRAGMARPLRASCSARPMVAHMQPRRPRFARKIEWPMELKDLLALIWKRAGGDLASW